jgi:hypothetical protein
VRTWIALVSLSLAAAAGLEAGAAAADEAKPAEAPTQVAAATEKSEPVKLPPGFKQKKRGKFIVYCRNEAPLGSRISQESCFDEAQMRDYLIALQETKGNVDRIRATCSNLCTCGMPEAC